MQKQCARSDACTDRNFSVPLLEVEEVTAVAECGGAAVSHREGRGGGGGAASAVDGRWVADEVGGGGAS
jgi:hypothetical protein